MTDLCIYRQLQCFFFYPFGMFVYLPCGIGYFGRNVMQAVRTGVWLMFFQWPVCNCCIFVICNFYITYRHRRNVRRVKFFVIGISEIEFHVFDIYGFILVLQCFVIENKPETVRINGTSDMHPFVPCILLEQLFVESQIDIVTFYQIQRFLSRGDIGY